MVIVLRSVKGSPLTHSEMDENFETLDENFTTTVAAAENAVVDAEAAAAAAVVAQGGAEDARDAAVVAQGEAEAARDAAVTGSTLFIERTKASVLVATTTNITLSGEQTLDGVLTSASRVLVKSQSTPSQNGLYVSAAGAWSRASDMNSGTEADYANVYVESGTTLGGSRWAVLGTGLTIGTTAMEWTRISDDNATIARVDDLEASLGAHPINDNLFDAPAAFATPAAHNAASDSVYSADGSVVTIPAGTANVFHISAGVYHPVTPGRLYAARFRVKSGTLGAATLQFTGGSVINFTRRGAEYYVLTTVPVGVTNSPTIIITNGSAGAALVLETPRFAHGTATANPNIQQREAWALRNYAFNGNKPDKSNLWTVSRSFNAAAGAASSTIRNNSLRIAGGTPYTFLFDVVDQATGLPALADRFWFRFNDGTTYTAAAYARPLADQPGTYIFTLAGTEFANQTIYGEIFADNAATLSTYTPASITIRNIQCYAGILLPSFVASFKSPGEGVFPKGQLLVKQNTFDGDDTRIFVPGANPANDLGIGYLFQNFADANTDIFNMKRVYEAERTADDIFVFGPQMTDVGQDDLAIYVTESINNFSGGDAHKYQVRTATAEVWIDGVAVDPADVADYACHTWVRKEYSEIKLFGTATKFADVESTWTIDGRTGKRRIHNKLTFMRNTTMGPTYMYMKTVARFRGNTGSDVSFDEVFYPDLSTNHMRQTTGSAINATYRDARKCVMLGPPTSGIRIEMAVLRGDFDTQWMQFTGPAIKQYVSCTPIPSPAVGNVGDAARTMLIGEVLELEVEELVTNSRLSIS